ncbi:MAG: 2-hydroxychromene-2-carboxylate isomerase [Candidatus Pelagadaptatus aseana]|uniref:2-hydroxychromene-2-carboxylate isomerase n=1 Tax=Candidatus Pelagadaptatus aseana TaxID=3120508 RepID=UPI0039B2A0CF
MTDERSIENIKKVEFFFDLGSPYSYFAATQIEGIESRHDVVFEWRPMLLGGLFKNVKNASPFYVESANKKKYLLHDLQAWAAYYGVSFSLPNNFPPNSLTAMRGAVIAAELGLVKPYVMQAYHAYFSDNVDISEVEIVEMLASNIGIPRSTFQQMLSDREIKQRLIVNTEEAAGRGAFGAPTFFYNGEMFFGNDRLCLLESAIVKNA